MLANIRPLPGLYGGGFARVVQVETLPSGSIGGAVSQAAVRLERLKDPLAGFQQSLAQFTDGPTTVSRPQQPISSNSLTLLQNIDPQQPLVPQFPPEQQTVAAGEDDPSSYAIQLARAESLRAEARAEAERKEAARKEALRQFEESSAPQESFGPDPLAKLRQSLEPLSSDLKLSTIEYDDISNPNPETTPFVAALAAQSYASAFAGGSA